jgi:Uma2 family endonuclease
VLTLPSANTLTPEEFSRVCAANPEAVLELDADGHLIEMTPTGSATSARNGKLIALLWKAIWQRDLPLTVFESSGGFRLPDGSIRSPDASVVRLERWQALSEAERRGFAPLCPDLVVELASPSDDPAALRRRMATFIANGASLGWLLLPETRTVEIWSALREGEGAPSAAGGASGSAGSGDPEASGESGDAFPSSAPAAERPGAAAGGTHSAVQAQAATRRLVAGNILDAAPLFPGLVIDLNDIWSV